MSRCLFIFAAAKEEAKKFMTPPVTPSKHVTTSQQNTATPDDVTRHVQMADVASDVLRMRKVKQKLDSVLVSVKYHLALFGRRLGGLMLALWTQYQAVRNENDILREPRTATGSLMFSSLAPIIDFSSVTSSFKC